MDLSFGLQKGNDNVVFSLSPVEILNMETTDTSDKSKLITPVKIERTENKHFQNGFTDFAHADAASIMIEQSELPAENSTLAPIIKQEPFDDFETEHDRAEHTDFGITHDVTNDSSHSVEKVSGDTRVTRPLTGNNSEMISSDDMHVKHGFTDSTDAAQVKIEIEQSELTAQDSNHSACVKVEPVDAESEILRPELELRNQMAQFATASSYPTTSFTENSQCMNRCCFCGEEFVAGGYAAHERLCPGKYDELTRAVICRCPVCCSGFTSTTSWRQHRTCAICGKLFGSGREYHAHLDCLSPVDVALIQQERHNLCPNCLRGSLSAQRNHRRSLENLTCLVIMCTFCGQNLKFCTYADYEDHDMNCRLDHKEESQFSLGNFGTLPYRGSVDDNKPGTSGATRVSQWRTFDDIHSGNHYDNKAENDERDVHSRAPPIKIEPNDGAAQDLTPVPIKLEPVDDETEDHQAQHFEMTHNVTSASLHSDSLENQARPSGDTRGQTCDDSDKISQGPVKRRKIMNAEEVGHVKVCVPGTDGPIAVTCRYCEQRLRFHTATECTDHVKACAKAGLGVVTDVCRSPEPQQPRLNDSDSNEPKATDSVNRGTESAPKHFRCPHCNRRFPALEPYQNHVLKMANGLCPVITCKYCEETMSFCSEKLCTIHERECRKRSLKSVKRAKDDQRCPHCNRRFTAVDAYENHVRRRANGLCPVITCKYCKETRTFCTNQDCTKHILECKELSLKCQAAVGKMGLDREYSESFSVNTTDIDQQTTTPMQQSSRIDEQATTSEKLVEHAVHQNTHEHAAIPVQQITNAVHQSANNADAEEQATTAALAATTITARQCPYCFRQFGSVGWCKMHVQKREEKPFVIDCNYCRQNIVFCTQRDGRRHMIECGGGRRTFGQHSEQSRMSAPFSTNSVLPNFEVTENHCPYCTRRFGTVQECRKHVQKREHIPPVIACDHCNQTLTFCLLKDGLQHLSLCKLKHQKDGNVSVERKTTEQVDFETSKAVDTITYYSFTSDPNAAVNEKSAEDSDTSVDSESEDSDASSEVSNARSDHSDAQSDHSSAPSMLSNRDAVNDADENKSGIYRDLFGE